MQHSSPQGKKQKFQIFSFHVALPFDGKDP